MIEGGVLAAAAEHVQESGDRCALLIAEDDDGPVLSCLTHRERLV